jgi:spore germination protein GerM
VKRWAAGGLMLLLVACGAARGAVAIPSDEIPFAVARSPQPELPTQPTVEYTLSFVRRGHLVDVTRDLPARAPQEQVMIALLDGPTLREADRAITTEIPAETRLLTVEVAGGVAEVNLSREFQTAGSSESVLLRVAEVVRTMTAFKGVTAVRFLIDGELVGVPTDSGVVERPVNRLDYASVRPAS